MSLARVACVIPARDAADAIQATVTAARAGADVGMTIDLLRAGLRVQEIKDSGGLRGLIDKFRG
ncbi:MAG: hypothetical protein QM650_18420 [Microlunatus sp.]